MNEKFTDHSLFFRHKFLVGHAHLTKKWLTLSSSLAFTSDIFGSRWWWLCFYALLWRFCECRTETLKTRLQWKCNREITGLTSQIQTQYTICSSVRLCGTHSAQVFLFSNFSWKIWRIVPQLMSVDFIILGPLKGLDYQFTNFSNCDVLAFLGWSVFVGVYWRFRTAYPSNLQGQGSRLFDLWRWAR